MSSGTPCRNQAHHPHWRVVVRRGNYSAFNGYRFTPSAYSERWRTKAAYVIDLPDM